MIIFLVSSIFAAITNFGISFLLFFRGWQKAENRIFSGVTLSVALWGLGSSLSLVSPDKETVFFWWQLGYIGGLYTTIFFFHFICILTHYKNKIVVYLVYLYSFVISLQIIFQRDLFFGELVWRYDQIWWFYWFKSKSYFYLAFYIFCYWILLGYAFLLLIRYYKSSHGVLRNQLKYLLVGSIVGWIGAEGVFLPKFVWEAYPYSNFLIAIYPVIFVFAMLRYRLMDISVAITRTGVFVAVYTLILGIPFGIAAYSRQHLIDLFGGHWWIVPLGVMAVLATVGPFLYIFVERRAEEALLKEQRKYQQTLKQASLGMTRIRNLHRLLSLIVHIVTKTVRLSYAAIYLHDKQAGEYVLQVKRDKGRTFQHRIPADSHLVNWLQTKREPIIYDEIKRKREDTRNVTFIALEERMREIPAAVIIPSFLEDKFMGFFVLGEKLSGHIYTPEDLNVFQVLATQAALAIENAQFYEETKELQGQIAQAEKMATIGTMADGLSHQINNRFYALSLIAGDSIDTIKMTDTTACSPEIREMLESINHALERIQSNVMQGGEVVKGILKYTRKGDEGIAPVTLDQVIDGTLDMVRYKIKLSEFDIVRDYTKELPAIQGNLVQLQEVFFNLIDNAYDAMMERKTTLQEPGYRGKLVISARENEGGAIEIRVTDNGIGVKDTHSQKIFTPFFTTKTSNRKGTGLGLYVINKIITDTHKGKINFASRYKEGTTFLIELPKAGETPPLQSLQPGV